jgi:hypothetical protein
MRLLSLLFLLPAGLSTQGTALAQGMAHTRAHGESPRLADAESRAARVDGPAKELSVVAGREDCDCERGWSRRARTRLAPSSLAVLNQPPALPTSHIVNARSILAVPHGIRLHRHLETGSPPTLRAPPRR